MRAVPADDLLTEAELAEYCRVSLRTVRRWRAEGQGRRCCGLGTARATSVRTWTPGCGAAPKRVSTASSVLPGHSIVM
jgi:hypothetical protein